MIRQQRCRRKRRQFHAHTSIITVLYHSSRYACLFRWLVSFNRRR